MNIAAGTAITDITPPLEVGLLMSSAEGTWAPFETVRMPLKARVLVLQSGKETIALVAMDLLALHDKAVYGWQRFKKSLSGDILDPDHIIVTCTHTHNAPESVALTDLYTSDAYRQWLNKIERDLPLAIAEAISKLQSVKLSYGEKVLQGYSLQRRVPTPVGMVISDSLQPISKELFERGPVDRRIKCLRLDTEENQRVATIVFAACHPVHEMCMKQVSPDFPGEACRLMDTVGQGFFFNGAAGDINPPTVSGGAQCSHEHGQAIAKIALSKETYRTEIAPTAFGFVSQLLKLKSRRFAGNPDNADVKLRMHGLRIGNLILLFIPGELFAETGLLIEAASPFAFTLVAGFSENHAGYVPPLQAFSEGGYETGPGAWSFLEEGAEASVRAATAAILASLWEQTTIE